MTVHSGYKEHLFPHNHYCWRETQHIWQRWLAVIAGRVPSYAGVWLSRSHYSVFGKYFLHPLLNGREKAALPVWNPIHRDSEKILTAVGWIYGWAALPGYILPPRLIKPKVHAHVSGLSTWWSPCLSLGDGPGGPRTLLQLTEGHSGICRGMLCLGRETSCGARTF